MPMDRMPNPKKPFIELTPRRQLFAGIGILALSYALGAVMITSEPPQRTEFAPNFDSTPVVVVPPEPPAAEPSLDLEVVPEPEPEPATPADSSSI